VIEFAGTAPQSIASRWIYATSSLSPVSGSGLEFFVESNIRSPRIAEMLNVVAHFHVTGARLDLHHIVNLGEAWLPGSACSYAYLSLPYQFGPSLEWLRTQSRTTRCLWLVPIAASERQLALARGIESLEQAFEREQPDLTNLRRRSAVDDADIE
jgi:hypothetical protein